jgi:hypothetical protein
MDHRAPMPSDLQSHELAYETFLRGFTAASYHIFFTLVALVAAGFASHPFNVFLAFGGLAVGTVCAILGFRFGSYRMPLAVLALYMIVVAISVSSG